MPIVKVNMQGVDPKESMQSDYNPVPPGMHRCRIISIDTGYAKGDNQKPDKSRPMLTVVVRPVEGRYSQLWYYLSFSDHDFTRRKMDQFMLAIGVLTTTKREASFNTDKYKGTIVVCNVQDEQEKSKREQDKGKYRPKVVDVFADSDEDQDLDLDPDDELETEFSEEEFDDEDDSDETEDEEGPEDEDSDLLTREDMEAMDVAALKAALKEYEVTTKTRTPATLVEMLAKEQAAYCSLNGLDDPAADEDPEPEDFEEDDDDEDEGDDSDYLTEAQLMAMDRPEFAKTAKDFDVSVSGKKRGKIIEEILAAQAAPDEEDEDEEPF